MIVAVDGPAGAGKSSVTQALAARLGIQRLDTGALYRAIAMAANREGVDVDDPEIESFVASTDVRFCDGLVFLNGQDVSNEIRTDMVGSLASRYAAIPGVRKGLLALQRMVADQGDFIVDGRDIGTVVFPDASVKLYLTASVEARAERRFLEYADHPNPPSLETIRQSIVARDTADSSRAVAPLKVAEDAIVIDSSEMNFHEVVERCLAIVQLAIVKNGSKHVDE